MYADGRPVTEIATAVRRSADAVTARRRHLRIPPRRVADWSPREDALLRMAAQRRVSATWLAARLGRTPEAVRRRRRRLSGRSAAAVRYSATEDAAILELYARGGDVCALARELGRSADAIRLRARLLGVHRPPRRRRWTFAEDAIVRDGYDAGRSCASIAADLPGRTTASVAARARKLGIANYARRWTRQDDALLARLTEEHKALADIARAMTRTPEAVRQRSRRLSLSPPADPSVAEPARPWSEREDALLHLHAGANPASLSAALGRSDRAVAARLRALGLRAGRERSPHHPAPAGGRLTPAQQSTLARGAGGERPENVIALSRRLDLPREQLPPAGGVPEARAQR
jgi:DNA-binding CsgD family transcriptional regulator